MQEKLFGTIHTPPRSYYEPIDTDTIDMHIDPKARQISANLQPEYRDNIIFSKNKVLMLDLLLSELTQNFYALKASYDRDVEQFKQQLTQLSDTDAAILKELDEARAELVEKFNQELTDLHSDLLSIMQDKINTLEAKMQHLHYDVYMKEFERLTAEDSDIKTFVHTVDKKVDDLADRLDEKDTIILNYVDTLNANTASEISRLDRADAELDIRIAELENGNMGSDDIAGTLTGTLDEMNATTDAKNGTLFIIVDPSDTENHLTQYVWIIPKDDMKLPAWEPIGITGDVIKYAGIGTLDEMHAIKEAAIGSIYLVQDDDIIQEYICVGFDSILLMPKWKEISNISSYVDHLQEQIDEILNIKFIDPNKLLDDLV